MVFPGKSPVHLPKDGRIRAPAPVAQVSKPAVSPISKSAANKAPARVAFSRFADLEIRDTADWTSALRGCGSAPQGAHPFIVQPFPGIADKNE